MAITEGVGELCMMSLARLLGTTLLERRLAWVLGRASLPEIINQRLAKSRIIKHTTKGRSKLAPGWSLMFQRFAVNPEKARQSRSSAV